MHTHPGERTRKQDRAVYVTIRYSGMPSTFRDSDRRCCPGNGTRRPTGPPARPAVRPEDAPDASGLLTTTARTGQLVGVAALGALYLGLLDHPGPRGAAGAVLVTLLVMAGSRSGGSSRGGVPPSPVIRAMPRTSRMKCLQLTPRS